mmetsp:Transcript_17692/g.25211  ORF Transcript_17692/g.25211 Transcript_17692/m.25211 type:complete len:125 (+) Transcript_17692:1524-1898(+)
MRCELELSQFLCLLIVVDWSLVYDDRSVSLEEAVGTFVGCTVARDMRVVVGTKGDVPLHEGQLVSETTEKKIDPREHWHCVLVYFGFAVARDRLKTISMLVGFSEHFQLKVPHSSRIAFVVAIG